MNTQISTKLAALAIALMMNSLLIGGVAYLFNGSLQQHATVVSLAHAADRASATASETTSALGAASAPGAV
jgi:hypothetical protein